MQKPTNTHYNTTTHQNTNPGNKENDEDVGGWTKVARKQKNVRNEVDDTFRKPRENNFGGKSKLTDFDKVTKANAGSFFFTNFPETRDSSPLWKMFSHYGNVVDVYIAFKRNKMGSRFGFVRFKNMGIVGEFEKRLKGILIGDSKLVINLAKFSKTKDNGVAADDFPILKQEIHPNHKEIKRDFNHSIKEAILGPKKYPEPLRQLIKVDENKSIRSQHEKCWMGKAKNFQFLQNTWDIVSNNGLDGCKVKYVGGLSLLFQNGVQEMKHGKASMRIKCGYCNGSMT
ncbi:hypothetical protein CTI12_AA228140 [Artemisia annua]|uniref:RRM domain-containing protein n=1 Tax=Artemisia annua TaxID=35608 RepID=A0A2U1NUA0_ARTAN|nr:hypothetical protein CTI12_AA228140 [Artemisia annua]